MSFENTVFKKISFSIQMISEKNLIDSCEKDQCFVHGSVRVRSLYILGLGCGISYDETSSKTLLV